MCTLEQGVLRSLLPEADYLWVGEARRVAELLRWSQKDQPLPFSTTLCHLLEGELRSSATANWESWAGAFLHKAAQMGAILLSESVSCAVKH